MCSELPEGSTGTVPGEDAKSYFSGVLEESQTPLGPKSSLESEFFCLSSEDLAIWQLGFQGSKEMVKECASLSWQQPAGSGPCSSKHTEVKCCM